MPRVALYAHERDNTPRVVDPTWDEFVGSLMGDDAWSGPCTLADCVGHDCPHKMRSPTGLSAWSPVRLVEGGTRLNRNVLAVTMLAVDLDGVPPAAVAEVGQRLEGLSYVAHSTHSDRWTVGGLVSLRIAVEVAEEIPAAEYPAWRAAFFALYGIAHLADPSCKDISRLYFLPSHPVGYRPIYTRGYGAALPRYLPAPQATWRLLDPIRTHSPEVVPQWLPQGVPVAQGHAPPAGPVEVDLGALRRALSERRRSLAHEADPDSKVKADLLGRVLAGQPIAEPGARGSTLNKLASICAFVFPANTPVEAFLEVIRPAMMATSTAPTPGSTSGAPVDHWPVAVDCYRRASARWAEERAKSAIENANLDALLAGRTRVSVADVMRGVGGAALPSQQPREMLFLRNADQTLKNCGENVRRLIERFLPGVFRWNDYSKRLEVVLHDGLESFAHEEVKKWVAMNSPDTLATSVTDALTAWLDGQVVWHHQDVERRLVVVAQSNKYNPLVDYMNSLRWDGTRRIDAMLSTYFGADDTPLMQLIGRMWMIGATERAMAPGSKFDNLLVFAMRQGAKKTSALQALAGPFFASTAINFHDKDGMITASSNFLVCLDELASKTSRDIEALFKSFITRQHDTYRPPYGKHEITVPRSAVFVATSDQEAWLTDIAGNRRFWIVRTKRIDMNALLRDRDQLWAEAVYLFRESFTCAACARSTDTVYGQRPRCAAHRWWFDEREEAEAAVETVKHEEEEPWSPRIYEWWIAQPPGKRPRFMTTAEIAVGAITGLTIDRLTKQTANAIKRAVLKIRDLSGKPCFAFVQEVVHGTRQWGFVPTEDAMTVVKGSNGSMLHAHDGGQNGAQNGTAYSAPLGPPPIPTAAPPLLPARPAR